MDSAYKDQLFTYYGETLTLEEINALTEEKETHRVIYNEPIDGIYGSLWNTTEEAKAAADAYIREHGLNYMESESEAAPESEH